MKKLFVSMFAALAFAAVAADVTITGPANTPYGPVTLTAHDATGKAFCSLNWAGWQLINQWDHGRCLQSAVTYNYMEEGDNPTEAGSYANGRLWNPSSSQPWYVYGSGNFFASTIAAAYWYPWNGQVTSDTAISKTVTIGYGGVTRLMRHDVRFTMPTSRQMSQAKFEILTGYMIYNINKFWTYNPATQQLAALSDGPGEQALPIIFSTQDGAMAIGIYSPDLSNGGYGRWRFNFGNAQNDTMKWNMVSRVEYPVMGADYTYRTYYTVGNLSDVQAALRQAWLFHN